MHADVLSVLLGFLEGLALILSPCVLPILPIILAVSLTGSRLRPLGITLGFIGCFASLAFFSRQLITLSHIDLNQLHTVSYSVLFFLGLVMMSEWLTNAWERLLSMVQNSGINHHRFGQGIGSGLILGALIAIIWVPCAGPILAAVIVQTVMQQANWSSFLIVLAFSSGVALPMLLIAWYGQTILHHVAIIKTKLPWIRKILGGVIVISVLWMVWRDNYPGYNAIKTSAGVAHALEKGVLSPYAAPELSGITAWINSSDMQLQQLHGQVVLVDFWTYSCVNCLRTLPHLNALYARYHTKIGRAHV